MPALLVHYSFALDALPEEDKPYATLVNLASQGPDTFMAYGSLPWRKRSDTKDISGYGHMLHRIDIGPTYLKMMDYADNSEHKELLYAFIDGLLMHYCVDRILHAYIFYRSGVDEKGQLTGYYSWSHGYFEAILDKTYAKRIGTYTYLPNAIKTDENWVKEASKMWAFAASNYLNEDSYLNAYLDFVGAEKMLWNPRGLRHPLFYLIGKYKTPNAQSHPFFMKRFEAMDVTNDKKRAWRNPATGEEHNESIEEMMVLAKKDFEYVHSLIEKRKNGGDIEKEFLAFTSVLCHEGHPIGMKKHIYFLCWEEVGKKKYLPPKK